MSFYVDLDAEDVGDALRSASDTHLGTNAGNATVAVDIEADGKHVTIKS